LLTPFDGRANKKPHRRIRPVGFIKFKNQPRTRPPRSTAAARSMAAGQDSSSRCQNISVMAAGQTVFALASLRLLP
jgi:hypothetical protein